MNFILGCTATNSVKLWVISAMVRSLPSIAVHDLGQFLDHRQTRDVTLELRNAPDDLLAENLVNLLQVFSLHAETVLEVGRDVLPRQVRGKHAIHYVPDNGHI